MRKILAFAIISIVACSLLFVTSCELRDTNNPVGGDSTSTSITIKVTLPNGGETIMEGSSYNIQWSAYGTSQVNIQFSYDNGSTWTTIADSLSNNGIFAWFPVPNNISNQCKIRISAVNGAGADLSDKSFSIVKNSSESLKLVAPVGGEIWEAGSAKEIKWFSSGLDSVKIEYTTDNGNHWNLIAVDKKNTGIYYWDPLPNTPSTLAKIRIKDAKDGDPSTESTNTFNISPEPKLRVISPNGGETLLSGGNRKIEWISENIANVKIAYTTNNGAEWTTIVASTPSIGFYNWTNIPNLISQNCKIKLYDASDGQPTDESDSVFTITNQVTQIMEVTSPNGDEKWQAGTSQNITWNSSGVVKVKIEFSSNNGITWNTITDQLNNTGAFEWNVPNSLSTQCLIKISDAADGDPIDQSNSRFSIVPKPDLKLIKPNGGEVWTAGEVDTIKWQSTGIEKVAIEYSTNNGTVWNVIVKSTESDGEYATSFSVPSNKYKIRIYNIENNQSPIDESDGTFTVTDQPQITVVTPNGGEEWYAGSSDNIIWNSAIVEDVKIEYTTNNGATWSLITDSTPSDGSYSWNPIPNISSLQCRIRISNAKGGIPSDVSDNNFSVVYPGNQSIKVTKPNGGEAWQAGSRQDITWNASGITNVKIEYTTNNGINWLPIVASTPSDGFYTWDAVPSTASTNCKIRISDAADGSPSDDSDNFFSIDPEPSIKVLAPNGGEYWLKGTNQEIRWTSENVENVKIEYTTNGGGSWTTIVNSVASLGSYNWSPIPDLNSLQCKVRISDADDGTPYDLSDANFQISNQVVKSLQVLQPNGGEDWEAGTKQNITWSSSAVPTVKIELTTNQGASWTVLADNITGGAYEWNIDQTINSTQCQVRVSDVTDAAVSDISNGTFTISPIKSITVTAPVGPVTFKDSDPITITWQSTGIKNVGIKYTTTNGVGIYPEVPEFYTLVGKMANQGSFTTSFSIPSDQYYVVVFNADEGANESPSARSIGSFTIVKTEVPSITLLTPNGSEQWLASPANIATSDIQNYHPYEIRWNSTGLEKVKIEWSTTGGGTWYTVPGADSTISDGIFVWAPGRSDAVRPDSSDNCLIRVSSLSGSVSDRTDGFFSIHESKKIRIEMPNGGKYYYMTADEMLDPKTSDHWPLTLTWTSYAISGNVNVYYSLQNGAAGTWQTLVLNYPSTGALGWDFIFGLATGPVELTPSTLLRLKIEDAADTKIWDVNDAPDNLNLLKPN